MEGEYEELYREIILDNYKNPRNKGRLGSPTASAFDANPLCGDEISMDVIIKNGVVEKIAFEGAGCAISIASASLLTQWAQGKRLKAALKTDKKLVLKMLGGIDPGPSRIKCAMLPLKVLKLALIGAQAKKLQKKPAALP